MTKVAQFTAAEAAFVLQEPLRAVKKALDAGPVRPFLVQKAGAAVRAIAWADLVYLFAARALRQELTPKARVELYEALQRQQEPGRSREVQLGRLRIAISDLVDEIEKRTKELKQLSQEVDFTHEGEPVLKGTDIEVHRIAALVAGGMTPEEVLVDYPSLTRHAVDVAKAYADAHPKPGRPYPPMTAKKALRAARLDALDEVLDGDDHSE